MRDVDGDGRPDFLHQGPYAGKDYPRCGLFGTVLAVPAVFLYHARWDGTYVTDDDLARADPHLLRTGGAFVPFVADPEAAAQGRGAGGGGSPLLVCARVYGADPRELGRRMDRARPTWARDADFYGGCDSSDEQEATECPGWLTALIQIPPPLRISTVKGE